MLAHPPEHSLVDPATLLQKIQEKSFELSLHLPMRRGPLLIALRTPSYVPISLIDDPFSFVIRLLFHCAKFLFVESAYLFLKLSQTLLIRLAFIVHLGLQSIVFFP
jgi:hypothetical protein